MEKDRFARLSLSKFLTENSALLEEATGIIEEESWRISTRQKYQGHTHKFWQYCLQRDNNSTEANLKKGIEYLTQYFQTSVSYSSVDTARSVLHSILKPENGTLFGDDPLVCRLLKGTFNLRLSLPWYTTTEDVEICLRYIKSLPSLNKCDLKISYRLAILFCLITAQRDQTISYMNFADKV